MVDQLNRVGLQFENASAYKLQPAINDGIHETPSGWTLSRVEPRNFILDERQYPGIRIHSSAIALLGRDCSVWDGDGEAKAKTRRFAPKFLNAVINTRQISKDLVEDHAKYEHFLNEIGASEPIVRIV